MRDFILKYKNARKCIDQINNGEWVPSVHANNGIYTSAFRKDKELWLAYGAFFCEISEPAPHFGWLWRHYVWWVAARKLSKIKTPELE